MRPQCGIHRRPLEGLPRPGEMIEVDRLRPAGACALTLCRRLVPGGSAGAGRVRRHERPRRGQLDHVARRESAAHDRGTLDAFDPVGTWLLPFHVHRAEQDVSFLCSAQRIGLDRARAPVSLFVAVVEFDQEMVRGGEANYLDEGRAAARDAKRRRGRAAPWRRLRPELRARERCTTAPFSQRKNSGSSVQKRSTGGSDGSW